jgi:hypothetical protein
VAGASVEAEVPASFDMTRVLVERMNDENPWSDTTRTLNFVCGALTAYDAAKGGTLTPASTSSGSSRPSDCLRGATSLR